MLVHKGGKIKNWGGGAEMSHLQNIRVDVNRSEVFVKIRGRVGGGGGQSGCE